MSCHSKYDVIVETKYKINLIYRVYDIFCNDNLYQHVFEPQYETCLERHHFRLQDDSPRHCGRLCPERWCMSLQLLHTCTIML